MNRLIAKRKAEHQQQLAEHPLQPEQQSLQQPSLQQPPQYPQQSQQQYPPHQPQQTPQSAPLNPNTYHYTYHYTPAPNNEPPVTFTSQEQEIISQVLAVDYLPELSQSPRAADFGLESPVGNDQPPHVCHCGGQPQTQQPLQFSRRDSNHRRMSGSGGGSGDNTGQTNIDRGTLTQAEKVQRVLGIGNNGVIGFDESQDIDLDGEFELLEIQQQQHPQPRYQQQPHHQQHPQQYQQHPQQYQQHPQQYQQHPQYQQDHHPPQSQFVHSDNVHPGVILHQAQALPEPPGAQQPKSHPQPQQLPHRPPMSDHQKVHQATKMLEAEKSVNKVIKGARERMEEREKQAELRRQMKEKQEKEQQKK